MKKRMKFFKKISTFLCSLLVSVTVLGVVSPYYALTCGDDATSLEAFEFVLEYCVDTDLSDNIVLNGVMQSYKYHVVYKPYSTYYCYASNEPINISCIEQHFDNSSSYNFEYDDWRNLACFSSSNGTSWDALGATCWNVALKYLYYDGREHSPNICSIIWADNLTVEGIPLFVDGVFIGASPVYDSSLGYLQNVKENRVYDKVPLGENVNDKFTARWYYDNFSTTGIDLTSGDYMIRYYQERWLVKGYDDDDVIEKSDRYVIGDYVIQNGYLETYSVDIDNTLAGQGFENWSSWDLLFGKFITTHHYFQIVNVKTNEVGGYLHVYYTDDNGKFGVDYIGETLDNEGNFDDSGYQEMIPEDNITSDDVEQGFEDLENGSYVDFGSVDGVDEFGVILESFASQVSNVTGGVHVLLSSMPPWVLGLLGVSFVLLIVGIIFKIV